MKTIIVGGSHGGVAAAKTLKVLAPDMEVLLIEKSRMLSYVSSSINLYFEKYLSDLSQGHLNDPETLEDMGIRVLTEHCASKIDCDKQQVFYYKVHQKENILVESYDYLILAMGSSPFNTDMNDQELENILTYKSFEESRIALQKIQEAQKITIVGAGYIGLELSSALKSEKKDLQVVDMLDAPLFRYLDSELTNHLLDHQPPYVHLYLNSTVTGFSGNDGKVTKTILMDRELENDLVIFAINGRPNSELLQDEIKLNYDGTVAVNALLQTSDPKVYAIGDLISTAIDDDNHTYITLVSNALMTGRIAAENICFGNRVPFKQANQTTISKIWGIYIGTSGLTEELAPFYNYDPVGLTKKFYDHAFEKDYKEIEVKLVFDRTSTRLIGGQFLASFQNFDLINLISLMISQKMTPTDILTSDFFYNAHVSSYENYIADIATNALQYFFKEKV